MEAWYIDSSKEDQRLPHHLDPPQYVTNEELASKCLFYTSLMVLSPCQMDARFCTENSVPFCLKLLWRNLSLHLGVVHLHLFHLWASRLDVG